MRLQSDLDRLQAALTRIAIKNQDAKFGALASGTIAGWSVGIKVEERENPTACFLLEGVKTIIKLDAEFVTTLVDMKPTGAIMDKLMELQAKTL